MTMDPAGDLAALLAHVRAVAAALKAARAAKRRAKAGYFARRYEHALMNYERFGGVRRTPGGTTPHPPCHFPKSTRGAALVDDKPSPVLNRSRHEHPTARLD